MEAQRRSRIAERPPADAIPFVPWTSFKPWFYREWEMGEHVSLIGPTGKGKTTLVLEIIPRRNAQVVFVTKPRDKTLNGLVKSRGFAQIKKWAPPAERLRVLLWPPIRNITDQPAQAAVFRDALQRIYHAGRWCIVADDASYLCEILKLDRELKMIWMNGRSIGISLVACVQRPAYVPLMAYDQPTHLFFFQENDENNLKKLGGMGGVSSKLVRETIARLDKHDVLYVNTRTADMKITRVDRTGG